ncbi:NADH-dependent flavin oxidoreductase [Staphylococcus sp. EG-SA-6]|jgi:2,4-dienoyl-CoA reductase-like NADH-dependent reductase (Old Yellow Enzyme family)|uniref:NADH-dependent flavin oxidoreductase n=2 Tax=Staphylococcus haemolyticus TaxID=1283 RepID=A0A2A1K6I4_STAHA|nr:MULTISPECIES: NADH-dependent flavin oxidoreductase [Staphylococcus]KDP50979.1 oxidoreductase, FAD/FMN dependent [Staphylococcus aureus subsp. aureus CO-98]MBN4934660.1 NADH-dependent flavin oxidoreductase [Staphylococcus sp. EG-SA-6]MDU4792177.1 NADH-dependent flavin oxidoreductase [Staphylococcus sp.]AKC76713.1 flavin oxidoreductase [Staphylococcus haemolyticus]AMW22969.1 NADH-dependent flavin oxidoreductase [Staphylococcus haemolyticus]
MNKKYEKLFETVTLPNGVELKNRFVLAPLTHISSNDDGTISDVEIPYIEKRSKDVGLAINAASNVNDIGKAFPGQPSVAHDSDIEGLKRLAQAMKKNGAKALVQIHHGGAQALANLTPNGDVVAPSPITLKSFGQQHEHDAREITPKEIEQTIKDFGEATRRVIEAGFDGVEIHGANHYLIHQFVSPYYNRRNDEWSDHMKFPTAVIDEVLKAKSEYASDDFIVGYRLSPEEAESPGISMEITEQLINTITEKSIDYVHISLGDIHSTTREGKYAGQERLKLIHQWVDGRIPVIGVGSVFTADDALDAIESTGVELVALGREILLDYNFISKIQEGKEDEILSEFDPHREDKHELTPNLWKQFNQGFYPLPRKDK